ncbi:MAG: hypothetical protein JJ934_13050 [Pseudomonadales bacterium]|nr:hypothetical protein [Pseudomonadales bacterium]
MKTTVFSSPLWGRPDDEYDEFYSYLRAWLVKKHWSREQAAFLLAGVIPEEWILVGSPFFWIWGTKTATHSLSEAERDDLQNHIDRLEQLSEISMGDEASPSNWIGWAESQNVKIPWIDWALENEPLLTLIPVRHKVSKQEKREAILEIWMKNNNVSSGKESLLTRFELWNELQEINFELFPPGGAGRDDFFRNQKLITLRKGRPKGQ